VNDAAAVAAAIADDPTRITTDPAPSRPRIGLLRDAFYEETGSSEHLRPPSA
jgi:hypothetical protein